MPDRTTRSFANGLEQQLLASMAHELKSPLTLISGLSSELEQVRADPKQFEQCVARIQFSSDRLLSLIDSVLRGYELNQNMLELNFEPVCPRLIMEDVANELAPHAKRQAQLIAIVTKPKRQTVMADRGCLHAVLFNLLDNAIKYSKTETTIELEERSRAGYAQLAVKNYGSGIKKSELKRLFSQFGRIKRPVPKWATATGMGLYIAKSLTEAMHGELNLSRRNDGSSFLVNLPLSRQASLFEI